VKKRPPRPHNEAGSTHVHRGRDEADYAVVRPTNVTNDDNDDSNSHYAYPAAAVPDDSNNTTNNNADRHYLELLPDPSDEPFQLSVILTRPETADIFTSVSGNYDDVTLMKDNEQTHSSDDVVDPAASEQQSAT